MNTRSLPTYAQIDTYARHLVKTTKFVLPFMVLGLICLLTGFAGVKQVGMILVGMSAVALAGIGFGFRHLLRLQDAKVAEFVLRYRAGARILGM